MFVPAEPVDAQTGGDGDELDAATGWLPRMTSTRSGVGRNLDRSGRRTFLRVMTRRGRRSFHRYMRSVRTHDSATIEATVERLAHLPLLTIFGARGDPLRFQPKWAARFADITQLEVPKGGHFPMCDDPDLVAETLTTWHRMTVGA